MLLFQAVSTAISGWFGEVCALEGDPDLCVLSPGAQVSPVFPYLLCFDTYYQHWLMLAEAGGQSLNTVTCEEAEVY